MGTTILAHGAGHLFTYFPLLFVGAAVFFIVTALRDGSGKKDSTQVLPTSPLSRQVFVATRRRRLSSDRSAGPSVERGFRRPVDRPFHVMDGDADDATRPRIPRTFTPPPAARKKA